MKNADFLIDLVRELPRAILDFAVCLLVLAFLLVVCLGLGR